MVSFQPSPTENCIPDPEFKQRLNHAARNMLSNSEDSDFPPILQTINRNLRRYRLQDRVTAYEVFNEAYNRAFSKLSQCEEIHNIPAWFRTTCFHIISEWSRQFKKRDGVVLINSENDPDPEPNQEFHAASLNCSDHLDVLAMKEKLEDLSDLERKILYLHGVGLSWDEVADRLIESGDFKGDRRQVSQTIAQRASRARRRLRNQDHDEHCQD